ncbi:MAG TPA: hypothetical protein VK935_18420 [Actinomycetospora sp.]|nr:hypothetical protein [Actinomycetospora sp.]
MLTKDRVGAGLAIVAAVVGLVLVLQFPETDEDDDEGPAAPPTSQVVPAPGQVSPAPGGPVEQPAPPQGDGDG